MVKRVVLMLAIWAGWALWQRAHGRSPEDPVLKEGVTPPVPFPEGWMFRE